ncbi:Zinc finger protein 39 [Araneus ventricosus]|uniref:Zinc finger protein 39 n=1 Tax=Araneus ventricosus TaxID=182803 RepID=A0A4Y2T999_ARAVE|nr:Zinc finger protein 39 [Araneus ventricosus]
MAIERLMDSRNSKHQQWARTRTYDSIIGHHCLNGWWIPGYTSRSTTVEAVAEDLDSMKQGSTHGPCVQINKATSVSTELVNMNPMFSNETYLYNQVTYGNDQMTYSSQDFTTEGSSNHLMTMNSVQSHAEECAISGLNNPALFHRNELGTNDCNMEMRLSSEVSSKIDRLTSMVCQMGLDKDNMNMPPIPDSSNNRPDFVQVDRAVPVMSIYKVPMLDVIEDIQFELKIQNDPWKLMNKQVERINGYEISSESNNAPVTNEDLDRIHNELVMGNKTDSEITEDKIRLSEIYRQFSKYGQINERILTKDDLDSMTNNSVVTESAPSRDFVLSNIPTHGSPVHTGSMNDQVRNDRTDVVMMRHKCNNASTECKIGLNDMNFRRGTEESATIGNSFTQKSDFFEDCHVDDAYTLDGPSFSEFNEHYTSVCLKDLQSNCNVKRHSMQRNSHLKKHTIIDKVIKQYKCDVCEKSFRQKWLLQRHAFTHTGDKPHECKLCGKKFSRKSNLNRHKDTHKVLKQYKCDACEKSFRRKEHLQRHAFIHMGDKPFKCEVCEKSFTEKKHLQTHVLTHTGDKPHECIICEKKFLYKNNLNRHSKTH